MARDHRSPTLRRLRFSDPVLERRFRRLDAERNPPPVRSMAAIALVVTALFVAVDARFIDSARLQAAWSARALMALGPAAALLLSFRLPPRQWGRLMAAGVVTMGTADAVIVALVDPYHRSLYDSGVLVLVVLAYCGLRLPLRLAVVVSVVISVADGVALALAGGPMVEHWVRACYLLGINAVGWVAARRAEQLLRQQFLDHVVLQGEHRELIRLSRRLEELSRSDELTGLGNRRDLSERIGGELAVSARTGAPVTVALIDLDRFKDVNDRLGHATGDELLREVAHVLRQEVRRSDLVFRLGGDEFCVLMPATTAASGRVTIERTLSRLGAMSREALGDELDVGFSAGCAGNEDGDTVEDLLERADAELYRAKRAGRGRVCGGEPALILRAI